MPDEPEIGGEEPIATEVEEGELYYYCTCGRSAMQPLCDGSHAGTNFRPLAWTADHTGTVLMCACKQTKTPPICDGSHETI